MYLHPKTNNFTTCRDYTYEFVLAQLSSPAPVNERIQPICIKGLKNFSDLNGTDNNHLLGLEWTWTLNIYNYTLSHNVKKLNAFSRETCHKTSSNHLKPNFEGLQCAPKTPGTKFYLTLCLETIYIRSSMMQISNWL